MNTWIIYKIDVLNNPNELLTLKVDINYSNFTQGEMTQECGDIIHFELVVLTPYNELD